MATAVLSIGQQTFDLFDGFYLVSGTSKDDETNALCLKHESVESKHAIIFVERDCLSVLDLKTITGTYLKESDGFYKRLPSMQKCSVENNQKIRFGDLGDGVFRLSSFLEQHHSSGFHDALDSSNHSCTSSAKKCNKDSFSIPETQADIETNNSVERDSFNIPETQLVNISSFDKNEDDNNSSIPETQAGFSCVSKEDTVAPNQEESQFVISTEDFGGCDLNHSSDDLLRDFDWLQDCSQATTVAAKQAPVESQKNDSKSAANCSSAEIDALNWPNISKNSSACDVQDDQFRSTTSTPDLFASRENSPSRTNLDYITTGNIDTQEKNICADSKPSAENSPNDNSTKTSLNGDPKPMPKRVCANAQDDDNIQLSNKENVGSCEASICDLDPMRVSISDKDAENQGISPMGTSSLIEKSLELASDKATTPKKVATTRKCNKKEQESERNLLLMKTPRIIADVFDIQLHSAKMQTRNARLTPSKDPTSQDTLVKPLTLSKDFDKLINFINKMNANAVGDIEDSSKDYIRYIDKTDKKEKSKAVVENEKTLEQNSLTNIDKKEIVCALNETNEIKIQEPKARKQKPRKPYVKDADYKGAKPNDKDNISCKIQPIRASRRLQSEFKTKPDLTFPPTTVGKSNKSKKQKFDSSTQAEKDNYVSPEETSKDSDSMIKQRRRSVRSKSHTSALDSQENFNLSSSCTNSTSSKRTFSSCAQPQNVSGRVTRNKSRTNKPTLESSHTDSVFEEVTKREKHSQTMESATAAMSLKIDKTRKRKSDEQKMDKTEDQPTSSKASKAENIVQILFTMVMPEKQQALLKRSKNLWTVAKTSSESNVLVMDAGNRTVKFLIAMARGTPIVTIKWVEAFNKSGVPPMSSELLFKDKKFEKEFKFSMVRTLDKASSKGVFEKFHFVLTQNLVPLPTDMKEIIRCAGGVVHDDVPAVSSNLYLISSKKDSHLWHGFRRKNEAMCITSTEAVMIAIMRYDNKILKKNAF